MTWSPIREKSQSSPETLLIPHYETNQPKNMFSGKYIDKETYGNILFKRRNGTHLSVKTFIITYVSHLPLPGYEASMVEYVAMSSSRGWGILYPDIRWNKWAGCVRLNTLKGFLKQIKIVFRIDKVMVRKTMTHSLHLPSPRLWDNVCSNVG